MGVHASSRRLRRELEAAAPMSTPEKKKRTLADFFNPVARNRLFPTAGNVVPQKRPSPSPATEIASLKRSSLSPASDSPPSRRASTPISSERENVPPVAVAEKAVKATPSKVRVKKDARTPVAPVYSPLSAPRSGRLPIRSPHPKTSTKPASVYKDARLFGKSPTISPPSAKQETAQTEEPYQPLSFATVSQIPASTQSVVRAGKLVAIRDSDEDDSDSLASLDEIFGKKKDDDETSMSSSPALDGEELETERRRALSAFTRGRSEPLIGKDKLRALYAKEKAQQFDISSLVNDHLDDEDEEQRIQKSRDQYDQSIKTLESGQRGEIDPKLLASLIQQSGGKEEDLSRLMNAVSRTEALSTTKSFSVFGSEGMTDLDSDPLAEYDFPDVPLLSGMFRNYDDTGRSRAYLSGYMSELATNAQLPDEVLHWTFRSVLGERDEYLRQSYIDCIRLGSSSWARNNVEASDVEELFGVLGADATCLKDIIQPVYHSARKKPLSSIKYLLTILDLFQAICQHMDFLALASLTSAVCRLMLDDELMSNASIASKVEETLQALLSLPNQELRQHITESILRDMTKHLHTTNLQAQLLAHIVPLSPVACEIRMKLALTFLLGSENMPKSSEGPATTVIDTLRNHINTSASFDTSLRNARKLNYSDLRSRTMILDTAISDGHRPANFLSKADELTFNRSVDALADSIKAIYTSINDSGASHMTRTEAKDALTALYWRVLIAVRTKPRKKKHIFDKDGNLRETKDVESEEKSREVMMGFLAKMREKRKVELKDEDVSKDVGSQSEPMSSYASAREEL